MDKIDEKIKAKNEALIELNSELNTKKDDYRRQVEAMEKELETKTSDFLVKLAKFEKDIKDPQKTINAIRQGLVNREKELRDREEEVKNFYKEITKIEEGIGERESRLNQESENINNEWISLLTNSYNDIRATKESLELRAKFLETRQKRLDNKEIELNDRIRTFRAAQNELLNKKNG